MRQVLLRALQWAMAGGMLGVPFVLASFWWLAVPGLAWLLHLSLERTTKQQCFWPALLAGSVKAGFAIIWFWSVYPLDWIGLEDGWGQLVMIGVYWLTVSVSMGVGFALAVVGFIHLQRAGQLWIWLFPFAVVIGEILGSVTFSIYSIGPASVPNGNFGFGYIGYALVTPGGFMGLAQWAGVYGLSFSLAAVVTAGYVFVYRPHARLIAIGVLIVLGLLVWFSNQRLDDRQQDSAPLPTVITVNTAFESSRFADEANNFIRSLTLQEAIDTALTHTPDIIVLPEVTGYVDGFVSKEAALSYLKQQAQQDVVMIDSTSITDERGHKVLRAYIFDTRASRVYHVDKQYLVPQGEFIPYLANVALRLLGEAKLVNDFEQELSYYPGLRDSYEAIPDYVPSVLFCMESVSPYGVKKIVEQHSAPLVVHPISHGWFNTPHVFWMNLTRMLQVQAIWNDTTIIESANLAPAKAYLPDGTLAAGVVLQQAPTWQLVRYTF